MRAIVEKNDWGSVTIDGIDFLPIAALSKAGVTPQIFLEADRKIATRREYDRPAQIRILIRSLLTNQPIYSASELAARNEEQPHVHPARSYGASGTRRRSHANRPALEADGDAAADYAAILAELRTSRPYTAAELGLPVPGGWRAAHGS
jgi:hypothetical protein